MTRTARRLIPVALALACAAGCQTCGKKKCDTCPPAPPPGAIIAPAPVGTMPPGGTILPPGGTILPPAAPPPGVPAAPPPNFPTAPASGAGYPPVASFYGPGVHLGTPEFQGTNPPPAARPPAGPSADIRLLTPEFGPSTAPPPVSSPEPPPANPPANNNPAATPAMPVGIVDFAPAIADRVAGGRKPALEGIDWLKANGYKSALLLRRPGENDSADRKQFEARGLTFKSLEVSPLTLSWAMVDEFAKLVGDTGAQPLFVYDSDGSLSGGLWYLYFRRVERLSDDAARLRAVRLGLKETGDGPQKEMWLAVQRLLGQK
jgi:hypothetical protein